MYVFLTKGWLYKIKFARIHHSSGNEAVRFFEQNGGSLTTIAYLVRILSSNDNLSSERLRHFQCKYPDFESIFHNLVNRNTQKFKDGLLYFIRLTESLSKYL